jgi:hypothetical protein
MLILYLYDIKAKNKRAFNRIKRSFYYHLKKLALPKYAFRTKSAFVIDESSEELLDDFFKRFHGQIEVYKVFAERIEEL